jgi:hypothetical protein
MSNQLFTDNFSQPLNGVTAARVDIHAGDGNLTIDRLPGDEQVLASGRLEYFERQGLPTRTLDTGNGQAAFTLRGGVADRPRFRLPWSACNGATEWQIHLNPTVMCDLTARSNGGNLSLNLAGMAIASLSAETGGGNLAVVLPEEAAGLSVTARSGAGNVTVEIGRDITGKNLVEAKTGAGDVIVLIPSGVAARIHATTGLGKAIIDPRFSKIQAQIYQSPDFDHAANQVEMTLSSGAGNVKVS